MVAYVPDYPGAPQQAFLQVAQQSRWDRWGEWRAAWCSAKIIMLTVGMFFVAHALFALFKSRLTTLVEFLTVLLPVITMAGIWIGVYYLAKAVL